MPQLDLDAVNRSVPILVELGVHFEAAGDGEARCSLPVTPRVLNPGGVLHGGITLTLADSGMGVAVYSLLHPGERTASVELSIRYLRPARSGRITAACRVIRRTNRFAIAEAQVSDEDGELIAVVNGSYYISRGKGRAAGE
jgi:acyl-CoA thioesterase